MIPLHDILEKIRETKKYSLTSLAKALRVSLSTLNYYRKEKLVPNDWIPLWVQFLDLPQINVEAMMQYNNREIIYRGTSGPEVLRCLLRDLTYFGTRIPIQDLNRLKLEVDKVVTSMVCMQDFSVREAIHDLRVKDEQAT